MNVCDDCQYPKDCADLDYCLLGPASGSCPNPDCAGTLRLGYGMAGGGISAYLSCDKYMQIAENSKTPINFTRPHDLLFTL